MFILYLTFSFLVGGAWVALSTILAEKLGSQVGGIISGLPSTVVVAFFFIAWSQGIDAAFNVTTAFPLAFSINAFFLLSYHLLSSTNTHFSLNIIGATLIWFFLQTLVVVSNITDFALSLFLWILIFIVSYLVFSKFKAKSLPPKSKIHYDLNQIMGRAILGGTIVSLAVLMTKIGGPLFGSVLASFPAVYFSTLIVINKSLGSQFTLSITMPMMISGMFNVVMFGIIFRFLILELNFIFSIGIAYFVSIIIAFLIYKYSNLI
jgi:uncharacterized membrane protein (GlpM family)